MPRSQEHGVWGQIWVKIATPPLPSGVTWSQLFNFCESLFLHPAKGEKVGERIVPPGVIVKIHLDNVIKASYILLGIEVVHD